MKRVFKIAMAVLFLLLLVGTFIFLWQKTRPKVVVYDIVTPHTDTLVRYAVATGKLEPRDEVLIKPQISGIISNVYKEAGQMVKAGEVIATVKVIPEMSSLSNAQSNVKQSEITLNHVQTLYDRVNKLYKSGVIAKEEYDNSFVELQKAKESLQNAKDNLEIVQNGIASRNAELSNTQIRSTITGMILDVPIKVGNSVIMSNTFNDGTTIASVADLSDMIFQGEIDETEIGRLRENMEVIVSVGALPNSEFDAKLEYISPKGVEANGVVQFEIKAATQIPDSVDIRAGYSANAQMIIDKRESVMAVNESIVQYEDGKSFLYVLDDSLASEQTFTRQDVELGLSDGISIEIISGVDSDTKLRGAVSNTGQN